LAGFAVTWLLLATLPRDPEVPDGTGTNAVPPPPPVSTNAVGTTRPGSDLTARIEAERSSVPAPMPGVSSPSPASEPVAPESRVIPALPPVRAAPSPEIAPDPAPDVVAVAPIAGRTARLVEEEPEPPGVRAGLPVQVIRTLWHPRAERRVAWIVVGGAAPREVREGEWAGVFEIRTIEPDGVLFADGPSLLHRRIGER
jgi:hypothetical protein